MTGKQQEFAAWAATVKEVEKEKESWRTTEHEETRVLLACLQMEVESAKGEHIREEIASGKIGMGPQIVQSRADLLGAEYTPALALWLGYLSDRPGVAVIYAVLVAALCKNIKRRVTIEDFILEHQSKGVYTEHALHKIWNAQKTRTVPDNLVDTLRPDDLNP